MPELIQRNFSSGELAPSLHARADFARYASGVATLRNFFVLPEGGAASRGGFQWVGEVKDNLSVSRLVPFQYNTEQTYVLEFTHLAMRVIYDGGYATAAAKTITGITQANPAVVTIAGHGYSNGDQVQLANVGGMTELNLGWFTVAGVTTDTFQLSGVDSTGYAAFTSGGTAAKIYTLTSPFAAADLPLLKYTQSADVMTLVHPSYDVRELSRTGHTSWSFATVSYAPTIAAPANVAAAGGGLGGGSNNRTYEYVVTAVDEDGVESLASTAADTGSITSLSITRYAEVTWDAVSGADHYNVYKAESEVSDVYGYIGRADQPIFRDYNLAPDMSDSPPVDRQPFSGSGNKPGCANYYQQRLVFGRTNNDLQSFFSTQSANYHSLRESQPARDDDAITFSIAAEEVQEIRHIVSLDALIMLTSGGVFLVTEGQDDVLTPSTVGARRISKHGSAHIRPAVVGNTAIYVQARGARVRDLTQEISAEASGYVGNDLSILSKHLLTRKTVVDMAYAEEPFGIVWMARSDGTLLGMTYQREHEIVAWHRHDLGGGGLVKQIAVISEGDEDVLYAVVQRTVDSVTRYYVERLHPRDWDVAEDAFCVDSGLTYSGSAVTEISGLRHLEGETVVALADGNVVRNLTVTDGKVNLPVAAETVHIGLGFVADIKTLEVDSVNRVIRGKRKNVATVVFKFLESRGGFVGPDENHLFEIKPRMDSDNYDALSLRTYEHRQNVQPGWNDGGQVLFRQSDPVPVTILAIAPDVDIG